ncbi:MAG: tetratricopeptide repeat protein [Pseudomonadota bacterium]
MSDYLSEEEQVERMKSWWGEYGTSLVVGLVLAVVGIFGWRWYDGYQVEQSEAAAMLYIQFQEAPEGLQRDALAAELQADFSGTAYHLLVLMDQARLANANGDLDAARASLELAVEQGSDDLLMDLARIRLAKVLHAQDQTDQALALLSAIKHQGYRGWAMETKGDIHISRDELELAHEAYSAAWQSLDNPDERPVLQMKLENTTPYDGVFVQLEDSVEDALREAESILDEAAANNDAAEDSTASTGTPE